MFFFHQAVYCKDLLPSSVKVDEISVKLMIVQVTIINLSDMLSVLLSNIFFLIYRRSEEQTFLFIMSQITQRKSSKDL